MKILYAVQGTGNGHVSRAREIIPILKKYLDVHVLISGSQSEIALPCTDYKLKGLGFVFGKGGGIDLLETYKGNKIKRFFEEIRTLPVEQYDLVINDFEPVSAWACMLKQIPCIALSHQAAVLNRQAPQPAKPDKIGKAILKNYAPADSSYGFHFKAYDSQIFTPVIRKEVRERNVCDLGHYTVYLPAYDDRKIVKHLSRFRDVRWQVFSKHNRMIATIGNISLRPITNDEFISSMAGASGILCGAGFETPAEALFLNKKLMVVPMKGQFEQQCNAAALKTMGVPVIRKLNASNHDRIKEWLDDSSRVEVNYPDITDAIITRVLLEHTKGSTVRETVSSEGRLTERLMKELIRYSK